MKPSKLIFDYLGSLISCCLLTIGLPAIPAIGLETKQSFFTLAWFILGCLVCAAFLKNIFKKHY